LFGDLSPTSSCAGIAVRRTASLRSAYDPRIHVFLSAQQDVDGRVKPGHDEHEMLSNAEKF